MYTFKNKKWNKAISIIVSLIFTFNLMPIDIARGYELPVSSSAGIPQYDFHGRVSPLETVSGFDVPKSFGKITELYDAGEGSKILIHIQDLHAHVNSQKKIAEIMDLLIQKYGIDVVLVEGGITGRDFSYIRHSFPKDVREEKALKLLEEGAINGENYIDIARDYDLKFQGVEEKELYEQNMEAFLKIAEMKESASNASKMLKLSVTALKNAIYSDKVKELEAAKKKYQDSSKGSVTEFFDALSSFAKETGLNYKNYAEIVKFIELVNVEKRIDFDKVEIERNEFVQDTCSDLSRDRLLRVTKKAMDLKRGDIEQKSFYEYLNKIAEKKSAINMNETYPELSKYMKYLKVADSIDFYNLYSQIDQFYEKAVLSFLNTEEKRRLFKLSKNLDLLTKMLNQQMTPDEYAYYNSNRKDFSPSKWADFLISSGKRYNTNAFVSKKYAEKLENNIPLIEKFYRSVVARDQSIVENSIQKLEKENENAGMLIAGGFHSANLLKILKGKGISYVVITPNTKIDLTKIKDHDDVYKATLEESYKDRMWRTHQLRQVSSVETDRGYTRVAAAFDAATFSMFFEKKYEGYLSDQDKVELSIQLKKANIDPNIEAVADVFRNKVNRSNEAIDPSTINIIHQIVIDKFIDHAYKKGLDERKNETGDMDQNKMVHVLLEKDSENIVIKDVLSKIFGETHKVVSEFDALVRDGNVRIITTESEETQPFWFEGHASKQFIHVVAANDPLTTASRIVHELAHKFFNADEATADKLELIFTQLTDNISVEHEKIIDLFDGLSTNATMEWKESIENEIREVDTTGWKEFENKIYSEPFNKGERVLAEPVNIAINTDSFPKNRDIILYGGVPRIIDALIRNMEGNPNIALKAIFLGDYSQGIMSDPKRLAKFLNSNDALGNSKYKVEYDNAGFLIINGHKIAIIQNMASPTNLSDLGIDVLIDVTRQDYIDEEIEEDRLHDKNIEEDKKARRIGSYINGNGGLKVIAISPDEDILENQLPLIVPTVNSAKVFGEEPKSINKMAIPTAGTLATSILINMFSDIIKQKNDRAKIIPLVGGIEIVGPNKQGNRQLNAPYTNPVLGLGNILNVQEEKAAKGDLGYEFEGQPIKGASTLLVSLKIKGYLDTLTADEINTAFQEMIKTGKYRNLVYFEGNPKGTASRFQTFNEAPLIILPVKADNVKKIRQPDGRSYRLIQFECYVSDYGRAKSILDFIANLERFQGNEASVEDKNALVKGDIPEGVIPRTSENGRDKVLPDGQEIPVVINALGRIGVRTSKRIWFDPNFSLRAINAVREGNRDIKEIIMGSDIVFDQPPFDVKFTADKKQVILTDKEERKTVLKDGENFFREETDNEISLMMRTVHGNLVFSFNKNETDKNDINKIVSAKFNGEGIKFNNIRKNDSNNTIEYTYSTKSGTKIKVVYDIADKAPVMVTVKKRLRVPVYNLRSDKNAYTKPKGVTDEDFVKQVREYNKKFALLLRAEIPELKDAIVFETSGQLKEKAKTEPFILAGARRVHVSAPTKATVKGVKDADLRVVPGVNTEDILPAWDMIDTFTALSCTTNGSTGALKGLVSFLMVMVGFFDTIHAVTNSQGRQFDEIKDKLDRAIDARGPGGITFSTTGASGAIAIVLKELKDTLSGLSIRVGNDDGSLVKFVLQVNPKNGEGFPTKEDINSKMREIARTLINQRTSWGAKGLKGIMGYGEYQNSLEIVGQGIGGIFDPKFTKVDEDEGTVSIGVWYDNEGGFGNDYVMLAILLGLYQQQKSSEVKILAQNVSKTGGYTGRTNIQDAVNAGADGVVLGEREVREWDINAKQSGKKIDPDEIINEMLHEVSEKRLPAVLNIYIPGDQIEKEASGLKTKHLQSVSHQIVEDLKGLTPHDIANLVIAVESDKHLTYEDIDKIVDQIRLGIANVISGDLKTNQREFLAKRAQFYFGQKFTEEEALQNYCDLIGANVSEQVRVILNSTNDTNYANNVKAYLAGSKIDGFILPREIKVKTDPGQTPAQKMEEILTQVKNETKDDEKRLAAIKRYGRVPVIIYNMQSQSDDLEEIYKTTEKFAGADLEVSIVPPTTKIRYADMVKKGHDVERLNGKLPEVTNVPVRVMVQNAYIGKDRPAFVDIDEAVKLGHDVLLGHSEIIQYLNPSNEEIAKTAKRAHRLGIKGNLIIAVGESEAQRSTGSYADIIKEQVLGRIGDLTKAEMIKTIIAYEPRWAIGTVAGDPDQIEEIHALIRDLIRTKYDKETAEKVMIIYGGSLNPENAREILSLRDVDGGLIGGVSVKPEKFKELIEIAADIVDFKQSKFNHTRPFYIGGNNKAYALNISYYEYVDMLRNYDRDKIIISLGPTFSRLSELREVFNADPLRDMVFIDEVSPSEIHDRLVFIREDFNLPIDDISAEPNDPTTWDITGRDLRVARALETVYETVKKGGIPVLMTHFEPKGINVKGPQSIEFMIPRITELLNDNWTGENRLNVTFVRDPLGSERDSVLKNAKPGEVIIFENLRYLTDENGQPLEKAKDPRVRQNFAQRLYRGRSRGDNPIRVTDGFGVVHRGNQASVDSDVGISWLGGMLLREELLHVDKIIKSEEPAVIVVGGTKVKDKVKALRNLINNTLEKGSKIFVVGGASLIFHKAKDPSFMLGKSEGIVNAEALADAEEIIQLAEKKNIEIILPLDYVASEELPYDEYEEVDTEIVKIGQGRPSLGYYDIGPKTVENFKNLIFDNTGKLNYKLIAQIGPSGAFEFSQFREGSMGIFQIMAEAQETDPENVMTVVGGGDTSYAATVCGIIDRLGYISTGGGGFIEGIEGIDLPGVAVLREKSRDFEYYLDKGRRERYKKMEAVLAEYAANTQFASVAAHTRSIKEYMKIADRLGVSADKREDFAKDLQAIGSMYTNNNENILVDALVTGFYHNLNMPEDFFEEELLHEQIELGLEKAYLTGDIDPSVRIDKKIREEFGSVQFEEFLDAFKSEYGFDWNKNLMYSINHIVAERFDGGYVPENIIADVVDFIIEDQDLDEWFNYEFDSSSFELELKESEKSTAKAKIAEFENKWRNLVRPRKEFNPEEKEAESLAERETVYADNLNNTLESIAKTLPENEAVMVALGEDWIKGMVPGAKTRYDVEKLVKAVKNRCAKKGFDVFVTKDNDLLKTVTSNRKDGQHVILLADENTVKTISDVFKDDDRAFLAGVNSEKLQRNSYMRLMEMVDISLRMHFGLPFDANNPNIKIQRLSNGVVIFIPEARPYKYTELKMIYKFQVSA